MVIYKHTGVIIVANVWWCFDNIKPNHHQIILYSTHTNYSYKIGPCVEKAQISFWNIGPLIMGKGDCDV